MADDDARQLKLGLQVQTTFGLGSDGSGVSLRLQGEHFTNTTFGSTYLKPRWSSFSPAIRYSSDKNWGTGLRVRFREVWDPDNPNLFNDFDMEATPNFNTSVDIGKIVGELKAALSVQAQMKYKFGPNTDSSFVDSIMPELITTLSLKVNQYMGGYVSAYVAWWHLQKMYTEIWVGFNIKNVNIDLLIPVNYPWNDEGGITVTWSF